MRQDKDTKPSRFTITEKPPEKKPSRFTITEKLPEKKPSRFTIIDKPEVPLFPKDNINCKPQSETAKTNFLGTLGTFQIGRFKLEDKPKPENKPNKSGSRFVVKNLASKAVDKNNHGL